jgi:WD40 repeat protein
MFCRPGRLIFLVCLALLGEHAAAREHANGESTKSPRTAKTIRTDRYGDLLPDGAIARLGSLRFRHEGSVYSLAFSPDDKILAGAQMMSGRIVLWDSRTGKKRREVRTEHQISSLAFSPDGKELAARSIHAEVGFWDTASGDLLREFSLCERPMPPVSDYRMSLVFAPDGKTLFVQRRGKFEESLAALDAATGKERHDFGATGCNTLRGLAVSPDGKTLALGASKPSLRLYDAASGRIVWAMNEHGRKDTDAVAFRADGKVLASGSVDKIVLSDPDDGKTLGVLTGSMGYIIGLAFTPDGRTLLSGSADGKVRVWDVADRKERYRLDAHDGGQALALSHDGKTAAFATSRNVIRLWDVATGQERFPDNSGHDAGIQTLAFSPDGKQIVSADSGLEVRRWDVETGRTLMRFRDPGIRSRLPALTADGTRLAALDRKSQVTYLWDTHTGRQVFELRPMGDERVHGFAFAPDGQTLVTAGRPNLHVWDTTTGRRLHTVAPAAAMTKPVDEHVRDSWPWRVALAPGGKTIALEAPTTLGMWLFDAEQSRPRFTLEEPSGGIWSAVFSPDGRTMATGGESDRRHMTVCLWETVTGEAVFRWLGAKNQISALVFSPDGRFVAAASEPYTWRKEVEEAETIRVWDTAMGREVGQFRGHDSYVRALAFSPDGTKLLAGMSNTTILVWDVAALTRQAASPWTGSPVRELSALWDDLGGDARRARRAVWELAAIPHQAVPFLKECLRPVSGVERHQLAEWIAGLDSDRFDEREEATRRLERLEELAEPALRTALAKGASPEARRRIQRLLDVLRRPSPVLVRKLRAVEALEKMGAAEARSILETLAGGAAEARLTHEAKLSLERLNRRSAGQP